MKIIKRAHQHRKDRQYNNEILDGTGQVKYKNGKIIPDQKPATIPIKFQRDISAEEKFLKKMALADQIKRAQQMPTWESPDDLHRDARSIDKAFEQIKDKFSQGILTPYEVTELLTEVREEDERFNELAKQAIKSGALDSKGGENSQLDHKADSDNNNDIPDAQKKVTHPHNLQEG